MKTFTKFTIRFAAYLVVVGYLCADLFLFNGPLSQRIKSYSPDSDQYKAGGVVARVFGHKITRKQLDRAVHERLFLEGKSVSDLSKAQKKLVEYAALGELIDHELMRVKVKVNTLELKVSDQEIDARLELFAKKFSTREELEKALKTQGFGNLKDFRNRIAARIQQEKYVAMRVDPLVIVAEEEITEFYETYREDLKIPERIRARHIFISTLGTPVDEAKQKLQTALTELENNSKTFAELALSLSADPASKNLAGDLGWMSRERLPKDFADPVFQLEKNKPTLIQTKLGFHIVELTDRLPAETPPLEALRDEIHTALAATKRHQAVNDFRAALRQFEKKKIDIFHDRLAK
ncbi:MAG: peptidylprolyl isomerase [Verrucomicrobiota bacterium]